MTDEKETPKGAYRTYVEGWLMDEYDYTNIKFGYQQDDKHIEEFNEAGKRGAGQKAFNETHWTKQLDSYLWRSYVLGLENPAGRQALAKFVATAMGMLESTVRTYGMLPEPGVTSGENIDNLRSLYTFSEGQVS